MVKTILLKLDEAMFYKLLRHKVELQKVKRELITWEDYVKILFGFSKSCKEVERANGKTNFSNSRI